MKKGLCLFILGFLATAANADSYPLGAMPGYFLADWIKTSETYGDVYTLQITHNATGLPVDGFDISVTGHDFIYFPGIVLNEYFFGEYTVFNANPSDLAINEQNVSDTELTAAVVYKTEDMGLLPALLSIVVPTGSITDTYAQLTVTGATGSIPMLRVTTPEPGTMSLLCVGALALLRKRRKTV